VIDAAGESLLSPQSQVSLAYAAPVASQSNTADELVTIFNRILSDLELFIQYNAASVFLEEGDRLRLIAARHYTTQILGVTYPVADVPLYQEIVRTKKPIVLRDVRDEPRFRFFSTQLVIQGWMAIPLIVNGVVQGVISFIGDRLGAFSERDAHLAQTFINQAAHTIEKSEMARTLAIEKRNLEMLYDLSQSMVETLDPRQVAERALPLVTAALGAYAGEIFLLDRPDSEHLRLLACVGGKTAAPETVQSLPFLKVGQGLAGWVAATRTPMVAADTRVAPYWLPLPAEHMGVELASAAAIPLLARDQLIGVLTFSSPTPHFFQPSALPTLQAIAAPVAMALQNARLFTEERNRYQEAESLRRATASLVLDLDLRQILTQLLERLRQVVPFDSATFMLLTQNRLLAVAGIDLPDPSQVIGQYFSCDNDLFRQLQAENRTIYYADIQQVPSFERWGNTGYVRGWMGIPLLHRNVLLGYLTVDSRTVGAYGEAEAALAQAFANQATITIVNAQLLQESQRATEEQRIISQILRQLNATSRVPEILPAIAADIHTLTGCDAVELAIFEKDQQSVTVSRHNFRKEREVEISHTRYSQSESAATETILHGQIHRTRDLKQEDSFTVEATYIAQGYQERICWPLQHTQHIHGSIQLLWRSSSANRVYNLEFFAQVVDAIGSATE
jgi:GAF domain-containing protein